MVLNSIYIRSKWLLIFFLLLISFVIISCAASKYKRAETLYAEGAYDQLIDSQFACQDTSEACFRLKYLQMESYFQVGDWRNALIFSREAIDRTSSDISRAQVNRVYLLRAQLIFDNFNDLGPAVERTSLLRELESDLYQAIELNRISSNATNLSEFQLLLIKTLLLKMDFYESKNLDIIHGHIIKIISDFGDRLTSQGYDKYYRLQADFKLYQPEVKNWIYKGKISADREELLLHMKNLYKDALELRKIPLYQQGFAEQIEGLLADIDDYMKQLVI